MNFKRQSACLAINSILVYSYDFLFNYTTVGQASRLNADPDLKRLPDDCVWLGPPLMN